MVLTTIFFYLFALGTLVSALMVISLRNPVHAVLFLILAFVCASGLFMLAGAEFIALILIVVYVGAVAVLFLFVVMMLDIDFVRMKEGFLQYLPLAALIGILVLAELLIILGGWTSAPIAISSVSQPIPDMRQVSNIEALGNVLYTDYIFYFQVAGLILLVAMIGAIVLTLQHRTNVKRQNVADQVARTPETAIEIKKVESGKGL